MSFVVGRDGNISLFRTGTLIAIVGILLVGGGIAAFFLDQNSYRVPLEVQPYPGAEAWGAVRDSGASRRQVFLVSGIAPEEVAGFYQQELQALDGNQEACERIPSIGVMPGSENDASVVPYWYKCLFQRSGLNVSHQTLVTIQPGVFNEDPSMNTQGMTVIEHSQRWQP